MANYNSDSDSDYIVEAYVKPDRVSKLPVNDESADILGNFDDEKRREIEENDFFFGSNNGNENILTQSSHEDSEEESELVDNVDETVNTKLSEEQMNILLRGSSKSNRYVLYVTNLNFETTKEELLTFFSRAGEVESVRIPKKRKGGFAFVEMATIQGFKKGFEFHNEELNDRTIKVQISEGGKKKSANKKNILKQKNRKLSEMRNEKKGFNKSGKFYDKNVKKEKEKEMAVRKRWRKKPQSKAIAK